MTTETETKQDAAQEMTREEAVGAFADSVETLTEVGVYGDVDACRIVQNVMEALGVELDLEPSKHPQSRAMEGGVVIEYPIWRPVLRPIRHRENEAGS